jgi:hypothetical protein
MLSQSPLLTPLKKVEDKFITRWSLQLPEAEKGELFLDDFERASGTSALPRPATTFRWGYRKLPCKFQLMKLSIKGVEYIFTKDKYFQQHLSGEPTRTVPASLRIKKARALLPHLKKQ